MKYAIMVSVAVLAITGIILNQNSKESNTTEQVVAEVSKSSPRVEEKIIEVEPALDVNEEATSTSMPVKTIVTTRPAKKPIKKVVTKKENKTEDKVNIELAAPVKTQTAITESKIEKPKEEEKDSKFSQVLDVSFNTDTKEVSDTEKGLSSQIWYFLTYKYSEDYNIRLWVDIKKDLADSYEETINNTRLTLTKSAYKLTEKLEFSPGISAVLPTSEKSKRNEELNFGIELNPAFRYSASEKLRLSYQPRIAKNFHEYTTSRTNDVNSEYRLIQFYSMGYSLSEKWSMGALVIYSNSWSYTGRRRDPTYLSNLSLSYAVNKSLSLSAGTIQGGSIFDRQNGPNENIELYDENETTLYGNFALRF